MATTRTIGPLHLEDLEPHRFEDMVRQLLYDFRPWRQLEATGRSGGDDGFDARGWEMLPGERLEPDTGDDDGEADENARPAGEGDRLWLVQCKREKAIGPKKLVAYLDAIPDAERRELYGLIFAAACDFSKQARDTFRAKAREIGLAEAHLWGKGEIEDMLFQPKNDHLLFAYFGVSLQARRRTLKTEVRARLAMKRKALKLLTKFGPVLIRDASDERYPYLDPDAGQDRMARGRWKVMTFHECRWNGLHVPYRRHFAFLDDNGEGWDYAECMNDARSGHDDPWRSEDDADYEHRSAAMEIWEKLPERNKGWLEYFMVLPYENILEIDEAGDEWFRRPHIYTMPFHDEHGPFLDRRRVTLATISRFDRRSGRADESKRLEIFPRRPKE